MFACCSKVYEKYLDDNGNIIDSELKKVFGPLACHIEEEKNIDGEIFKLHYIRNFTIKKEHLCTCNCHIVGLSVRH